MELKVSISELRGVKPMGEAASVVRMKVESKNPRKDLPNQEKNEY